MAVRPVRIVVLINMNDSDWHHTAELIIAFNSIYWGGWNNIIIPTDGNEILEPFWSLLVEFAPDFVYFYEKTKYDDVLLRKESAVAEFEKSLIDDDSRSSKRKSLKRDWILTRTDLSFNISVSLQDRIKREVKPFALGISVVKGLKVGHLNKDLSVLLSTVYQHTLGKTMSSFVDYDFSSLAKERQLFFRSHIGSTLLFDLVRQGEPPIAMLPVKYFEGRLDGIHELIPTMYSNYEHGIMNCPFNVGMSGLSKMISFSKDGDYDQRVIVVIGNKLEDYFFYYTLQRMKFIVTWLPSLEFIETDVVDMYYYEVLNTAIGGAESFGQSISFTSISVSKSEVEKFLEKFKKSEQYYHPVDEVEFVFIFPQALTGKSIGVYERDGFSKNWLAQFYNQDATSTRPLPLMKSFPDISPISARWIVEQIIGPKKEQNNEKSNFVAPNIRSVLRRVFESVPEIYWSRGLVRSVSAGYMFGCPAPGLISLSYSLEQLAVEPRIHILDGREIFELIFEGSGYEASYSDKGKYQKAASDMLGSLQELGLLLENSLWKKIFDSYLNFAEPKKRVKKNIPGVFVDGRVYQSFSDFNSVIADVDILRHRLDELIDKGVFIRGLVLKCERCDNASWYALKDVGERFQCKRCSIDQKMLLKHWRSPIEEPKFYYALDEVFFQGYSANMSVPVLALNQLLKLSEKSFLYCPEMQLRHKVRNFIGELDILAIRDGKVIIGEAKVNGEVELKELEKYHRLTLELDAVFVFALIGQPTQTIIERINKFEWTYPPEIITL